MMMRSRFVLAAADGALAIAQWIAATWLFLLLIMMAFGTYPVIVAYRGGQCVGAYENLDVARAFSDDADEFRPVFADWRYWGAGQKLGNVYPWGRD